VKLKAADATEEGEDKASKDLAALNAEVTAALAKPEVFAEHEKKTRDGLAQEAKDQVAWKASYKAFLDNDLAVARLKVQQAIKETGEGDEGQLKDLKKMAERANDTALKQKDFKQADAMLKDTRDRALQVQQTPQGLKAASRGNLAGANGQWKKAV